jgi:hypothetical protein
MASKGCVLVSWQPRHQQDEETAGEEASTGGADTKPSTRHVSRPDVAVAQAVRWRVACRTVASTAVMAITKWSISGSKKAAACDSDNLRSAWRDHQARRTQYARLGSKVARGNLPVQSWPLRVSSRTPAGVAPHDHAKAVELDLMYPAGAGRRAISGRRKARLNKRRHTHTGRFIRAPPDVVKPMHQKAIVRERWI